MGMNLGNKSTGRKRRYGGTMSEINVTPFVDVMLVLLIIFMVAAPMMAVGVPVNLPDASAQPLNEQKEPLVVHIDSSGKIFIGQQEKSVELDKMIPLLMAVAENYPQLKADSNFQQLQAELSDIENKIAAARRFFNNATSEYNTVIQQFPAVLIARMFGFREEVFFELDAAEKDAVKTAPNVNFGT